MYGSMLQQLAQKAAPQPASLGFGQPPSMSGLPPPPTGLGPMPTGAPGTDPKAAADQAIVALRDVQGHFPALKPQTDAMIDSLKNAAKASSAPPAPALGAATPPGSPTTTPTVLDSGSAGSM